MTLNAYSVELAIEFIWQKWANEFDFTDLYIRVTNDAVHLQHCQKVTVELSSKEEHSANPFSWPVLLAYIKKNLIKTNKQNLKSKLSIVEKAFNPSTREAEAGRSLSETNKAGLHSLVYSQGYIKKPYLEKPNNNKRKNQVIF